jgi:phosphoribosyl-AMP cyclohydrolase
VSAPETARVGVPIAASEEDLGRIRYDAAGLVVTIVQEASTKDVLMVAYMDSEALRRTLESGRTWFFSRSRQEYWLKGETSGDRQWVRSIAYDCDGDALLVTVDQDGAGACHTGAPTCFFRVFGAP